MRSKNKYLLLWTILGLAVTSGLIWLLVPSGASYATGGLAGMTAKAGVFTALSWLVFNYLNFRTLSSFRIMSLFMGKKDTERHLSVIGIAVTLLGLSAPIGIFFLLTPFAAGIISVFMFVVAVLALLLIPTPEAAAKWTAKQSMKKSKK